MTWTTPTGGKVGFTAHRDKLARLMAELAPVIPDGSTVTYKQPWRPTK